MTTLKTEYRCSAFYYLILSKQTFTSQLVLKKKFCDFSLTFAGNFKFSLSSIEFIDNDKLWDEITNPFSNFNSTTIEVWEWISNFIPHFITDVITYPCWD